MQFLPNFDYLKRFEPSFAMVGTSLVLVVKVLTLLAVGTGPGGIFVDNSSVKVHRIGSVVLSLNSYNSF